LNASPPRMRRLGVFTQGSFIIPRESSASESEESSSLRAPGA